MRVPNIKVKESKSVDSTLGQEIVQAFPIDF